ncbi:MAG: hypothetical protein ABSD38_24780, partial [Syntrophorhabdales bacterium]
FLPLPHTWVNQSPQFGKSLGPLHRPSPEPYLITTWKEVVQEEKQIRGLQEGTLPPLNVDDG